MLSAAISRAVQALLLLVLMSAAAFALVRVSPGDPGALIYGPNVSPSEVGQFRERWGLDSPLPLQYLHWLANFLRGDLGLSYLDGRPVVAVIAERIPATLALTLSAFLIATVTGVAFGLWSGLRPAGVVDRVGTAVSLTLYSTPSFWLGILLLLFFSTTLGLLPAGGTGTPGRVGAWEALQHLLLPAVVLASRDAARIARVTRSSVILVASEEYVVAAVAKGLPRAAVSLRHVLPNALLPVLALLGTAVPGLLGGAVVVETVFSWPGMGRLMIESALQRNYPVVMGEVMCVAMLALAGSLMADVACALADPRTRHGRQQEP